ncbi:MAG TPA: phage tail fiber protein, partial [Gemmatimonadales bacterium]
MKKLIAVLCALVPALALAAVTTTLTEQIYTCNGSTTAFTVPFRFLDQTHLTVTKTDSAGATSSLALGADYSVASTAGGGTVTLTSASKCISGYTLKIQRNTPRLQPTALRGSNTYSPRTHEDIVDRNTMIAQELKRDNDGVRSDFQGLETYVDGLAAGGQVTLPVSYTLTGDGASTVFSVPGIDVASATSYWVAIDGVLQKPTADYSLDSSADTITFTSAPPLGAAIEVRSVTYSKAQAVNDNTTITATGSSVARTLRDRAADEINVADFCSTGSSDHTACLQAALSAGAGKTVFIPPGTWIVSPTASTWLSVASGTTVRGAGPASVIKVKANAGDYLRIFGQATPPALVSRITFRNFRIDQNPSGNTTATVVAGGNAVQFAVAFDLFDNVNVE